MKQVLIQRGEPVVAEVPSPHVESGTILVQVQYSCISTGTELNGIASNGQSLWQRAWHQPQQLTKVLHLVANQGLGNAYNMVQGKLTAAQPCGYSAAGTVVEVGPKINDLKPGDRVACAGAQWAYHAQQICVPRNLAVPVPENLGLPAASTVALGAIALQGVRRASPTLGETIVVLGLGLLGQLTVQLLKANGCSVIGTDLDEQRVRSAEQLGMDVGLTATDGDLVNHVARRTGGHGADAVIITAASHSSALVASAFRMCRRKGRVVLVGDVGLDLHRSDIYEKELDFYVSTSYGPGRYDDHYEEEGLDYPIGYVRWTENRNMGQYLNLLSHNQVKIDHWIDNIVPIEDAPSAYAKLRQSGLDRPLLAILAYPLPSVPIARKCTPTSRIQPSGSDRIQMAVIGAGNFAQMTHLPNLQRLNKQYRIRAIVSRHGHSAVNAARRFAADCTTTDVQEVLADPQISAVLIATRHHQHASLALAALKAGKHVFVEKPLALLPAELEALRAFYQERSSAMHPVLMAGFNRRFSPYILRIKDLIARRSNPMIINYRMNAGYLPGNHWVHGPEGGGRNRGEACHIYDLFTFLTESTVHSVQAQAISPRTSYYTSSDNFVATFRFDDGSVGNLIYTSLGDSSYSKECMEIFVDGKVLLLDDYKRLQVTGIKAKDMTTRVADKGHHNELVAFGNSLQNGGDWPIPLWHQLQATEMAFQVEDVIMGAVR